MKMVDLICNECGNSDGKEGEQPKKTTCSRCCTPMDNPNGYEEETPLERGVRIHKEIDSSIANGTPIPTLTPDHKGFGEELRKAILIGIKEEGSALEALKIGTRLMISICCGEYGGMDGRNKDCKSLWVMGVPRNFNDDVPLEYADRFAVYIDRREPRQPESQGLGYLIG